MQTALEARFWSKVRLGKLEDCWEWAAARDGYGYGVFRLPGRTVKAHRFAYEFLVGSIPAGHVVAHRCDNPPCVNPAHLFTGGQRDNLVDMREKGRGHLLPPMRGEAHARAKLTEREVYEIRAAYARGGVSHRALAAAYGVSHNVIGRIIRDQLWRSSV